MNHIEITQRLLARKFSRLSKAGKIAMGVSLLLCLCFYGYLFFIVFANPLKHDSFVEKNKCPACYGKSKCDAFQSGELVLNTWTHLPLFRMLNVKNVYLGQDGSNLVILKRLARTAEMADIDNQICRKAQLLDGCDVSDAIKHTISMSGTNWMTEYLRNVSDMTACPTDRLLERVFDRYKEKIDAIQLSAVEKMYLLTTLMFNQEPILLQTFPHEEGWPFPAYLGACGRMVMVDHGGSPLKEFLHAPFAERVKLSYQLLQIAEMFVDNDSQFALYWTDLDPDNVMVDSSGQVLIVDVENIIVVDRWQINKDQKPGWDAPYYVPFTPCSPENPECISFSRNELCTKYTTDFNYYAVCRSFLSRHASDMGLKDGLLHSIPEDLEERAEIISLLEECVRPSSPNGRLQSKDSLLQILRTLARRID
ncbi:hypothetical protein CAPTEDRAFT_141610 [Capitella teleta]|uniref:FAM69 protein-kinase domain-containing protein n=1 Tax=Capitella teleta TaxID=283909 RepID=R7VFN7_CAPTE|nr:hypothetical protein CAPTEDRAFT_141610 [Capitella teleta]|eukprot:ELU17434.1 hypothetical protein CAPTEDRAFT_141610 [Capitella teleta]